MSLASWRTNVKNLVAAVPALASVPVPVYDYVRHVTDDKEVKDLLVASGRMHFWCVTGGQSDTIAIKRLVGCDQATYTFDVHGYYALADAAASEKAFLDIAEAVFETLRATKHQAGDIGSGPPQWLEHDWRMLSGPLCHHVRFSFPIRAQLP